MDISVCVADEDYEAWRQVRIAVVPGERCDTVAELRAQDSADRLLLLARIDGTVVGSGLADRSDSGGSGFVAPRVLPQHRRRGVGSALLRSLAAHVTSLGLAKMRARVDDLESAQFAERFGFVESNRQIEQVRDLGQEPPPSALPKGVEVIALDQQPDIWAACFDTFGSEVLADFAVFEPLQITAEQWSASWAGDPMFLALCDSEVIGCAGLFRDTDRADRAENALTAVRRDWRGLGIASHLKRRTLLWAADQGLTQIYTWTQARNASMLRLNEHLGYITGKTSITLTRPLPL
jgi:GNAT superfamily N-acetyltransferase